MKIVVIGGIAGGTSAAAKAKRTNKSAEIVIYEKGKYVSVGACGIPYVLGGYIPGPEKLIVRRPEDFEKSGIKVKLEHEVVGIDLDKRKVLVRDPQGRTFEDPFDRLIIATGASARKLDVPGSNLRGVFTVKGLDDLIAIESYIKKENVNKILIVGGGFIALELISAFRERGFDVYSLYYKGHVPSRFDRDVVEPVLSKLDEKGVKKLWNTELEEIEGRERVERVRLKSGEIVEVDMVIMAVGVKPNPKLAKEAGLELSVAESIKVDEHMQTSEEGIYAAGDCTHCYSVVTGKPIYLPLGSIANRHGRVAGTNAAGGKAIMAPVAAGTVFKFFELGIAKTGLTEREAINEGFNTASVLVKALDKAHYFPGAGRLWIKLVWEKESGRLLGAQMVGPYTAVKRIDVVSALLHKHSTIEDLKNVDMAYSPPFSPAWDPLSIAANQAVKE